MSLRDAVAEVADIMQTDLDSQLLSPSPYAQIVSGYLRLLRTALKASAGEAVHASVPLDDGARNSLGLAARQASRRLADRARDEERATGSLVTLEVVGGPAGAAEGQSPVFLPDVDASMPVGAYTRLAGARYRREVGNRLVYAPESPGVVTTSP